MQGDETDSDELKDTLRGVVQVVFGAVYFDWKLMEKGAVEMMPAFGFILSIFKLFYSVKHFRSKTCLLLEIKLIDLMKYDIPLTKKIKTAIKFIVRVILRAVKETNTE